MNLLTTIFSLSSQDDFEELFPALINMVQPPPIHHVMPISLVMQAIFPDLSEEPRDITSLQATPATPLFYLECSSTSPIFLNYSSLPYIQAEIQPLRKSPKCLFSSTKKRNALISQISMRRTPQLEANPNLNTSTITAIMIRHIIQTAIPQLWTRECSSLRLSKIAIMSNNLQERRSLLRQPRQRVSQFTYHTPRIRLGSIADSNLSSNNNSSPRWHNAHLFPSL